MALMITPEAGEAVRRAYAAAARFNPDARVRVARRGDSVEVSFVDGPDEGDAVLEHEEMILYVEDSLTGVLDVAPPHERFIVRPE